MKLYSAFKVSETDIYLYLNSESEGSTSTHRDKIPTYLGTGFIVISLLACNKDNEDHKYIAERLRFYRLNLLA